MKDAVELARYMPEKPSPEEMSSAAMAATVLKNARADDGAMEIRAGDSAPVRVEPAIVDKLINMLGRVSNGDMVGFVPANSMVTSYQAASIINVSHEFFLKLLESGEIKHLPPGYLHRVSLVDLMNYLERRTIERSAVLEELARLGQECDAACSPDQMHALVRG